MACLSNAPSFVNFCGNGMGGVRAILVALRSAVGSDFYEDDTWGVSYDGDKFKRIPGRGSFQSVAQVDETTGQVYYRDELNFTPDQTDDQNLQDLAMLGYAGPDDLVIIVETWNEKQYIMGLGAVGSPSAYTIESFPVFFAGGQLFTGTEKTDANGQSFVLTSVHPYPPLAAYVIDAQNPSTD